MTATLPWVGLGAGLVGAASLHLVVATALFNAEGDVAGRAPPRVDVAHVLIGVRPVAAAPMLLEPALERSTPADVVMSTDTPGSPSDQAVTDAAVPDTATPDGRRHFAVSEVDTPALPLPEWQVDVSMLVASGVHSFSVEVLIGDTGVAEHCAVTRIQPEQPSAVRDAVAATLCTTALSPAIRRGVAVPSVRHIELILAPS